MNLKLLNKTQLDERIKDLVKNERRILHEILLTIKEIDQRRTFLELGFPSLFSYLVDGVGYSAGSAQRRIEAARLLKYIPEIGEKLQSGELKLTQISLLQKASREAQRTSNVEVTLEDKKELLERLVGQSFENSQKEVALYFDQPLRQEPKRTYQADGSLRLEINLSKELDDKIKKAQSLISHSVPSSDLAQFLEYVADKIIQQKTQVRHAAQNTSTVEVKTSRQQTKVIGETKSTATAASATLFSVRQKKILLNQSKGCEFRHPITQKICGGHWFLQVDHKHSRWAGGQNTAENGQVLCGAHNRLKYQQEASLRFLS